MTPIGPGGWLIGDGLDALDDCTGSAGNGGIGGYAVSDRGTGIATAGDGGRWRQHTKRLGRKRRQGGNARAAFAAAGGTGGTAATQAVATPGAAATAELRVEGIVDPGAEGLVLGRPLMRAARSRDLLRRTGFGSRQSGDKAMSGTGRPRRAWFGRSPRSVRSRPPSRPKSAWDTG